MDGQPSNILLIVIDSLRYDKLSCYGYEKETSPFLDTFADKGIKFDHAYAPAPWTVPVHGSLFTGMLPSYHGSHRKSKTFKQPAKASLAGILSKEGYQTTGVSANPWLSPEFNFDNGFNNFEYLSPNPPFPEEQTHPDHEVEDIKSIETIRQIISWASHGNSAKRISNGFWKKFIQRGHVGAKQLNETILELVDESSGSNQFVFVNYMDVHDPHYDDILSLSNIRTPSAKSVGYQTPLYSKQIDFRSEPADPERARQLYDQSIRRLNERLQELFNGLENKFDMDDTLSIILGDHGECMGEHKYWGHGTYLYDELLRVPLLIQPPDTSDAERIDENQLVSLLDLPGYIGEAVGTTMTGYKNVSTNSFYNNGPIFAECTGPRPNVEKKASQEGYRAVINNKGKLIRNLETDEINVMLSDESDKRERDEQELKNRLIELEQERWSEQEFQLEKDKHTISKKTKDHLSELGYL